MASSPVKSNAPAARKRPNLLEQFGQGLHEMLVGKKPAGKPRVQATKANAVCDNPVAPGKTNANKPKAGTTANPRTTETARPVQVIHKFDSKNFQKSEQFGGLVKTSDRTHQIVQQQDKNGIWQVHLQPVESGRKNPNQHVFSSIRQVTVKDFNDTSSTLRRNARGAEQRLNADSNRLPDAPTPPPVKKPDSPKLSTGDWAKQQAANLVGGASSSITSTIGYAASLPELTVKLVGSVGDLGKGLTNQATGGRVFKTALNPIVYDRQSGSRKARPLTEQAAAAAQGKINATIGANAEGLAYKGAELVAPLLLTKKGAKPRASEPVGSGAPGRLPGASGTPKPQAHPVEGLKNAVRLHQEGKIGDAALNEAMSNANAAFKTQKGPNSPSWSDQMRKDFIARSGVANSRLSGAQHAPTPAKAANQPPARSPDKPATLPAAPQSPPANGGAPNTPTASKLSQTSPPLSSTLHVVKTAGGKWRIEHAHGQAPTVSSVVRAVADGTLTPAQLKKANFSDAAIKGITNEAKELKAATNKAPQPSAVTTTTPAPVDATTPNTPRSNGPTVPASTARRLGESMHDYLARHGVKQSLDAALQGAADNAGLRMSLAPEKTPQLQAQPATKPTANEAPQYAERPIAKPLDVKPRTSGEIAPTTTSSKPATASNASTPTTARSTTAEPTNPSANTTPASANAPVATAQRNPTRAPQTPAGVPPGGVPPSGNARLGNSADQPQEPPRLLTPLEESSGELAQPFGQNINPSLRQIVQGVLSGAVPMDRFNADMPRRAVESTINESLARSGVDIAGQPSAAKHIITVAEGLDVNPAQLTTQLIRTTRDATQQVERYTPQNPLLVDGSKAATLNTGTRYFTSLFSQGVAVPAQTVPFTFDGKTYDISKKAGLQTTAMNSDIDGPFAASYGQQGLDVTATGVNGKLNRFHVQLPEKLNGTPLSLSAPRDLIASQPSALLEVEVRTGSRHGTQSLVIPVTAEVRELIRSGGLSSAKLDYVESLSARVFPQAAVEFWKGVSQQNGAGGGEYPGQVQSPAIVFNTFGSMGQRAYDNSAELVTSLARSLQPGSVPANVEPGLFAAKDLTVYSGGSAVTKNGVSEPFGLSGAQESAMKQVAAQMPELVTRYARAYGLSKEATDAWQSSIFANPDIPSIIIPRRTVMEFANRSDETHPGKMFPDLQRQIESDLTDMVNQDRGGGFTMAEFVKLHHTPSNAGDTVAVMEPAVNGKQKDFTLEWQFAVKGQKAVPVLDSVANDLKKNFNIDLKTQLEADGYAYGELRKQGLDQTVEFLSTYARSRIEAQSSGKDITPRVIVPVDTYYEADGKVDGSDASLTRSAAGLYTPGRTHIVQVDTGGGKPTVGREQQFRFGTDAQGNLTLDRAGLSKPAVDGNGPNGSLAPTVYVRSAADMGEMFNRAYREQSPLSRQEVDQMRRRQ